jgi:hypothetical protein
MSDAPNVPAHDELGSIWRFLTHVLVGSFLFAVTFAPAVGLDLLIRWLKDEVQVSEGLAFILSVVKYLLAGIDAVVYLGFVVRKSWGLLRILYGYGG